MKKVDLIKKVSLKSGYDEKIVTDIFDSIIRTIQRTIIDGEKITLRGFGTFETYKTKVNTSYLPTCYGVKNKSKISLRLRISKKWKKRFETHYKNDTKTN